MAHISSLSLVIPVFNEEDNLPILAEQIRQDKCVTRMLADAQIEEVLTASKSKKKTAPDDTWFLDHVDRIEKTYSNQSIDALMAMGGALMGMGMRSHASCSDETPP